MNPYEKEIELAWAKYQEIVNIQAELAFIRVVKPWLEKYNLGFVAGNGCYFIWWTENTPKWFVRKYQNGSMYGDSINIDKIPSKIKDILSMSVNGMDANDLGSIMPDFEIPS
jgi:hypothetical protein